MQLFAGLLLLLFVFFVYAVIPVTNKVEYINTVEVYTDVVYA